jgi:ABC-type multidrug transport system fused ATPase/permease subunit
MSTVTEEAIGNVRTVKAFANEEEELKKFLVGNQKVKEIGIKK